MLEDAHSRRALLTGLAAMGAISMVPCRSSFAAPEATQRIDMHHHFFSPGWKETERTFFQKINNGVGIPPNQGWTVEKSLADMKEGGVQKAVLSLASIPGNWFGGDPKKAADLSQECIEYGAKLVQEHKGTYGLFAPLPMIDVDASLKQIGYALDVAKADGIGLATVYGTKYPGDPMFDPIFAELNRRKAVVYFHPNTNSCCGNLVPELNPMGGPAVIEVPTDTARCVTKLLLTGTLAKYRDIKWMFAHSGGSLPSLAGRIANFVSGGGLSSPPAKNLKEIAPNGVMAEFARLYFDTANAAWPSSMAGLLKIVPASHVMFGSDFPYFSCAQDRDYLDRLGLSRATLAGIDHANAERLVPQLRSA
jgi:predicted TIM-barrel fold metal-dependent hydrolase